MTKPNLTNPFVAIIEQDNAKINKLLREKLDFYKDCTTSFKSRVRELQKKNVVLGGGLEQCIYALEEYQRKPTEDLRAFLLETLGNAKQIVKKMEK